MFITHHFWDAVMKSDSTRHVSLCVAVKQRNNWHRHDYTEPDDGSKPVQAGTPVFIKELQTRTFPR